MRPVILAMILYVVGWCMGFWTATEVYGHELELGDTGQLTNVRMAYCVGYALVETEELGIMVITKSGDFNHNQLHYTLVDEFDCVYNIVEDD